MSDDALIRVENVSKKFCKKFRKSLWYGVKDIASDLTLQSSSARLRPDEFWALNDVSFELKRGECLGLVGHNGAGKTTLLKLLNGLVKPDKGRIEMRGRIGALLALNAGFHENLTGRENTYVNGAILGLSKREVDRRMDEIIEFADVSEFIDSPVKSYSAGMAVRLGFAIACHTNPDVLLIDEVLAVGDMGFKIKCINRMLSMRDRTALIFVSHAMPQIAKVCNSGLLLSGGRIIGAKEPTVRTIGRYLDQFQESPLNKFSDGRLDIDRISFKQGSEGTRVLYPLEIGNAPVRDFNPKLDTTLEVLCRKKRPTGKLALHCTIADMEQKVVAQAVSNVMDISPKPGSMRIRAKLSPLNLNTGRYTISVNLVESQQPSYDKVVAGIGDFAELSIQLDHYVGGAPIIYEMHTEITADVTDE